MEIQIVGKSAILIYVFYKISNSNPNTNFWFSIISQSKSQLISEIFWFPIPTYFPTFSVDLFPNSKLSWEKIIDRSEVEDTKNYFLSCFDLRVWTKNWNKWCCLTFFWVYEFFIYLPYKAQFQSLNYRQKEYQSQVQSQIFCRNY